MLRTMRNRAPGTGLRSFRVRELTPAFQNETLHAIVVPVVI